MSQSLAQIYLHLVFSTKGRHPFLQNRELREQLHCYLGGVCNRLDCPVLRVGGVADHILCRFGRSISVAEFIKVLKKESSKWLKTQSGCSSDFSWQSGYGAFSVSPAHVKALISYIQN
jgi:REP element-mobilizing transposase RayT